MKRFEKERYGIPSDVWRTAGDLPPHLAFIRDFCPFDGGWFVFLPAETLQGPNGELRIRLAVTVATLAGFSSMVPNAIEWEISDLGTPNSLISLSCNKALSDVFIRPALTVIRRLHPDISDLVDRYLADLSSVQDSEIKRSAAPRLPRKAGPTENTRVRFAVLKKLKHAHPGWTQNQVALEASQELGEYITADALRNTYRAMGEKWSRTR